MLEKIIYTIFVLIAYTVAKECPFRLPGRQVMFTTIPQENEILTGKCYNYAEQEDGSQPITISCYQNGNYTATGQCFCRPGFYLNDYSNCIACENGFTKSQLGNGKCIYPGRNTVSCGPTTKVCACRDQFFRVPEEIYIPGTNCYEPGKVRYISYSNHSDGSVIVTWLSPFSKSPYQANFLVSTNDGVYQPTTSRKLSFPQSNHTTHYKINIITQVKIGDTVYKGDIFTKTITVHKTRYDSKGGFHQPIRILISSLAFVSLVHIFFS